MTLEKRSARLAALVVLILLLAGVGARAGHSASKFATSVACGTDDLQAAIDAAVPGATLSITGTCQGTFVVDKTLVLQGSGGATLDAQGENTALIVENGARVTVRRLTITNGSDGFGGGIDVFHGTLSLFDSTVSGNEACHGGGIATGSAVVYITGSTVTGNAGDCEGGGIYAERSLLIVSNSTISGNTTTGNGGGLGLFQATATLVSTAVQGNTAVDGGGIYDDASGGSVSLLLLGTTSVSGNTASGDGGGVLNTPGGHVLIGSGANVGGNTPNDCSGC